MLFSPKRVYMDHASTTPTDKRVRQAMEEYERQSFENPSSLYKEGVNAKKALLGARTKVARLIHARSEEIVFTGSGTEADNLAILGVWNAAKKMIERPHIVTTNIEHPAVLETCRHIESLGGEVTYVPVEENGIVRPEKIVHAIKETTVLVSVMLVNNEIGTIQPVAEISRQIKKKREQSGWTIPYVHTDASQAVNYLSVSVQALGVDLMTLDGSKMYGPKGIGMLFVGHGTEIESVLYGGGQEKGLRPGTENVAAIIGFAEALQIAKEINERESTRMKTLQQYFLDKLKEAVPEAYLNGDREKRLPNNINICIPGINSEFMVIQLDHVGVACSSVSACKHLSDTSYSYVVEALGEGGRKCKESSLRFTMGKDTTESDIDFVTENLKKLKPSPLH